MNLARIVQIMWLVIAAVCTVEAYRCFTKDPADTTNGAIFAGVTAIAFTRYILLRRAQFRKNQGK